MQNIVITTEEQKVLKFLKEEINRDDLALYIRRAVYIMSKVALDKNLDNDGCIYINPEWLGKGFYWLNEFAEILNPYLDKERT